MLKPWSSLNYIVETNFFLTIFLTGGGRVTTAQGGGWMPLIVPLPFESFLVIAVIWQEAFCHVTVEVGGEMRNTELPLLPLCH